jgi:hypothetical protein
MAGPAGQLFADGEAVESNDVLSNLLNLRETKLLYSASSENDNLVNNITYRNVFTNQGCHGIRRDYMTKKEGINTTTIYVGNTGTPFVGHMEDVLLFCSVFLRKPNGQSGKKRKLRYSKRHTQVYISGSSLRTQTESFR